MKTECSIVRDLLPLYVEETVSHETAQYINEHLKGCDECRGELEDLKAGAGLSAVGAKSVTGSEEAKPFGKMMKRMNRHFHLIAYAALIFLIFIGFGWTAGDKLMYNSLIMPIVGIFGYYVFGWRAVYKVPVLMLLTDLAMFAFKLVEIGFTDTLIWTLLYAIFVLVGVAIAFLLHYALKKGGKETKIRILKISALCLAILLIIGACWFANGLVGNPVSKMMARHAAEKHLEANYSDTDYEIEGVFYSFKEGGYYAHAVSPSRMDGDFAMTVSMFGKLIDDTYGSQVEEHGNVANRLFFEYRKRVDAVLESPAYPYSVSLGYGDLEFEREVGAEAPEGALTRDDLVNDRFYNVGELGAKNGSLVLYIDSDTVSCEKAAEILLKTKESMDRSGISFYSVHLVLRYPPYDAEISHERPDGEVDLLDFLSDDIYEEGMLDRVEKCAEDTRNYYEEQDRQKIS